MLALDEPGDNDQTTDIDGFSFVVDKELMAKAAPIHIDLTYAGFSVTSSMAMGQSGGCGSSCGSGASGGSGGSGGSCAC